MRKLKKIKKDQYVIHDYKRSKGFSGVDYEKRKDLERLLDNGISIKDIALKLNMSRSTIHYERLRMGSIRIRYDAAKAQKDAEERIKVANRTCDTVPLSHKKYASNVYRILKSLQEKLYDEDHKKEIDNCLFLLEKLGVNPDRIKKRITIEEIEKIAKLHEEGKSLSEIERIIERSRSTIFRVIQKDIKKLTKEEMNYEQLKNKWINSQNN